MITNIQYVSFFNHYGSCKSMDISFMEKQLPQELVAS
jgi:hypothetical protein